MASCACSYASWISSMIRSSTSEGSLSIRHPGRTRSCCDLCTPRLMSVPCMPPLITWLQVLSSDQRISRRSVASSAPRHQDLPATTRTGRGRRLSPTHPAITDSTLAGAYGTLTIAQSGAWAYNLANGQTNVQNLAQGETAIDTFTVQVTDEHGASDTEVITITVMGSNDAPVMVTGPVSRSLAEDGSADCNRERLLL